MSTLRIAGSMHPQRDVRNLRTPVARNALCWANRRHALADLVSALGVSGNRVRLVLRASPRILAPSDSHADVRDALVNAQSSGTADRSVGDLRTTLPARFGVPIAASARLR